uniref:Protein sleepless n=1 Tax=Glossina brevipalpis TaxID=37001 RepID=A0A1A9W014_9MUSC
MSQKIIHLLQLLVCVGIPTAYALECYQCNSLTSCVSPTIVQCDQSAANRTRDELKLHYLNVLDTISSNYMCLRTNSSQSNGVNTKIYGCIYDETKACNLTLNTPGSTWSKSNCFYCSSDLCNSALNRADYSMAIIVLSVTSLLLTNVCQVLSPSCRTTIASCSTLLSAICSRPFPNL